MPRSSSIRRRPYAASSAWRTVPPSDHGIVGLAGHPPTRWRRHTGRARAGRRRYRRGVLRVAVVRRPLATVAVVVDTPGGIGQAEVNAAPAEVKVVVRAAGIGAQRRGRNCRSRARLGNDRAGRRRMTGSTDQNTPQRTRAGLPARSTFERQVIPGRASRRESHYSWS